MSLGKDKNWIVPPQQVELEEKLIQQLGVSPLIARLMSNRGVQDCVSGRIFLWGTLADLHNPFLMKGMETAAQVILSAVQNREKICVYGDYDVDGMTGVTLLMRVLHRLRADVVAYIPNRLQDGYGVKCAALDELKKSGVGLVVTVDCGITSCAEVRYAGQLGIKVVVTDHHQPGDELPAAEAVLNPLQPDCEYPFKQLAGVGVALKLAQGILSQAGRLREATDILHQELDLVALGTIADVVPLQGENRILVKYGLKQLTFSPKSGIKALGRIIGLHEERMLSVGDVAFKLAPRLNAAGRMGYPTKGFQLLISEDDVASDYLAKELEEENQRRRLIEDKILSQARSELDGIERGSLPKVIVLAGKGWHSGVIGIVASRLVEEFSRPVLVIALEDGIGKGSGRSISKFHLQQALNYCQDLLLQFGGHKMAAGFSIEAGNIPALKERLNQLADQTLGETDFIPTFRTDGEIALDKLDVSLWQELQLMSPFGMANPTPLFYARKVELMGSPCKVGNNHLKMKLRQGSYTIDGIGFNMGELIPHLIIRGTKPLDVVFQAQLNVWQGKEQLQLSVRDIVESGS